MPNFDLVIKNGTAIVSSEDNQAIWNAIIGVKDGLVAYVGTERDQLEYQAAESIDATGCVIIPGLINVHTHTMLSMLRGQAEDMGFAPAYTKGVPQGYHMTPDEAYALAQLGALEALLFGSTLVWDTYVHAETAIEAIRRVGIRVATCSRIHDVDLESVPDGQWKTDYRMGEELLDEALSLSRRFNGKSNDMVSVHLMPHAPDTCSPELLRSIGSSANEYDLLVHTHLSQSQTEVKYIRETRGVSPAEYLLDVGLLNERLTAAHCIFVSESDIELMRQSGMTVAHIPKGNMTGGTCAPTHAFRKAGINVAVGTDNMHGDMIEVMRWALNVGRLQEGCVSEFWQPHHALEMATIAGAKALRLEKLIGSIEVGKAADLVILDFKKPHLTPYFNPLGTLLHTAQGSDVKTVLIAGITVVQDGHATQCDEVRIIEDGMRVAKQLWERAATQ